MSLQVLYEDDFIIAVNKPSGVTTIPGNNMPRRESLVGMAEEHCGQKLYVVHRLDRETSGAVVFAKTPESHKALNMQFDRKEVGKTYIALVEGVCDFNEKEINIPVSRSRSGSRKPSLASKGLEAITRVKVIKRYAKYTLLEVNPLTGKRHQIRLHLKAIGHPLAFDRLYGRKELLPFSEISGDPDDGLLARMPLHAFKINIKHPVTGETIEVTAPLPREIRMLGDDERMKNEG